MDKIKFDFLKWLKDETTNCTSVVEFGSMFFGVLSLIHETVKNRIGIEIHKPYIDKATFHNCIKIHGNMKNYRELVDKKYFDCALFVDSLEHLNEEEAIQLIESCKVDFNKIVLMIPEGLHPQTYDLMNMGAEEYQTHRSVWTLEKLQALNFNCVLDKHFHEFGDERDKNKNSGCLFCTWNKK